MGMKEDKRMRVAVTALRDQLVALMKDHEQRGHGGEQCYDGRIAVAAEILHTLGIDTDNQKALNDVYSAMVEIEADCPQCKQRRGEG